MAKDHWMRDEPLNDEQFTAFKKKKVAWTLKHYPGASDRFSCDGCGLVRKCLLAFDPYNTDGDCLYEK